jgi:hypothetical protein
MIVNIYASQGLRFSQGQRCRPSSWGMRRRVDLWVDTNFLEECIASVLPSSLKMEAIRSFITLVFTHNSTQIHNSEEHNQRLCVSVSA